MDTRINISSGAKWEDIVGYSRAVRTGNIVEVSGTTAVDGGATAFGTGSVYLQAKFIFAKIEKALNEAGAEIKDVVRTRIYVTDISQWQEVAKAHHEVFGEIKPATTMVEVKALISPEYLVEIEASAVVNK